MAVMVETGAMRAARIVGDLALFVEPLLFGQARLAIGHPLEAFYRDAWDYPDELGAVRAMCEWDPVRTREPAGWHRHPFTGRCRPDGDPDWEYNEADRQSHHNSEFNLPLRSQHER